MELHRKLSKEEVPEFKQWARDNFKFFNSNDYEKHIGSTWHPVVQEECKLMRREYILGLRMRLTGASSEEVEQAVLKLRGGYS